MCVCSAKMLVRGEPNVSYICSRYYRAPELIFGATDYTCDIGMLCLLGYVCVCGGEGEGEGVGRATRPSYIKHVKNIFSWLGLVLIK